jgi:uncharacterized protein (TIGR02217 family)
MAFHDIRLPEDVERGASGGPRFKTTIMVLGGGHEKRNIDWSQARAEYDVGYGIESKQDFTDVIEFFYARQGAAHSFRFKDWADFTIGAPGDPVQFATGDGTTTIFQARKPYSSGGITYYRDLTKLVSGTLEVYVNDVLQVAGTDYTVDLLTGIITFTSAPSNTHSIKMFVEFDIPVRFAQDHLDISMETFDAGSIPSIRIIEVRGE